MCVWPELNLLMRHLFVGTVILPTKWRVGVYALLLVQLV